MSSWGKKLTTKINALNESSSKESIQTLAKWIGFNRKHAAKGFVPVLKDSIVQAKTGALQLTRLSIIHEVLVLDKEDPDKWQRMEELRLLLAECVLLPLAPQLQEPAREEVRSSFLKAWDDANSFSGPTLINQIRKSVSTKSAAGDSPSKTTVAATTTSPETTTSPSASKQVTPSSSEATTGKEAESKPAPKDPPQASAKAVPSKPDPKGDDAGRKVSATSTSPDKKHYEAPEEPPKAKAAPAAGSTTLTYDFEASGIPAEKMDPKTLLEPTKTIASLQIARDLRNDGAVQLSSLLANLPENIRQSCKGKEELTADKARDYAMRTPDVLIDMDLEEQLQSIRMYRDIVKRQRAARKQLIRALIASRCQFGAQEAAEGFENAHRARGQLLKRKQVLMDAMELEGQDCTQEEKNLYSQDATDFAPLEWHKKARTEEAP
eukprot:scaffold1314_cov158-Amphora_coffeaeformis.AAC.17